MAARELKRPVKVVYTRTQMYSGHGYRPYTIQKVALGAERSGKLSAMIHEAVHNTSSFEEFSDGTTNFTRQVYACPNLFAPLIEVKVDPDLGTVRVARAIEVTACGRIMNPKASHSQEIGGVVWGIGMALQEATEIDHRYGRIMNPNLQHYHVPVNADVHEIETLFVEEDDTIVNPLGVKGMGELGMVGIPAAIANAVLDATGRRIRELPITPDKLL
jgi:xanthine dehydrogenase YagR molybdenum-binding subunit